MITDVSTHVKSCSIETDWNIITLKAKSLKYKERRKLIKKTKRKIKRRKNYTNPSILDASPDENECSSEPLDLFSIGPILPQLKYFLDKETVCNGNGNSNSSENVEFVGQNDVVTNDLTPEKSVLSKEEQKEVDKNKEIDNLLNLIDKEAEEWHNPYIQDVENQEKNTNQNFTSPVQFTAPTASASIHSTKGSASKMDEVSEATNEKETKGERCFFYDTTGCCRFGDNCQRRHKIAKRSSVILLTGMFKTFAMEMSDRAKRIGGVQGDLHDLGLEYSEDDMYNAFEEFSNDALAGFEKFGRVLQLKVCCNRVRHLQGNVYVEYERKRMAKAAIENFMQRFYDGKKLDCKLVRIPSWKKAICGFHYRRGHCQYGDKCNFLHVFKDKSRRFQRSDNDYYR